MELRHFLLLTEAVVAQVLLSQPEQSLYVSTNGNARIRCSSHEDLDTGRRIFWYKKTWLSGETPRLVTRCASEENPQKYKCDSAARRISLEILNVTGADSGIYYCAMVYVQSLRIANGTALIVQDSFTINLSIHVLTPLQIPHPDTSVHALDVSHTLLPDTSVQLTCVVRGARHMLRVTWNISGIHHTGRMITMEDPAGTRTFLNHISITRDAWERGEGLSCDVWNHSSVSVHREIPRRGVMPRSFISTCSFMLRAAMTGSLLLAMALSVHLSWTYIP